MDRKKKKKERNKIEPQQVGSPSYGTLPNTIKRNKKKKKVLYQSLFVYFEDAKNI